MLFRTITVPVSEHVFLERLEDFFYLGWTILKEFYIELFLIGQSSVVGLFIQP